jgi:hypothetical protein
METADGIVEGRDEEKELDVVAHVETAGEDGVRTEAGNHYGSSGGEESHGRGIEGPRFHYDEGGAAQLVADGIEVNVLFALADEGLDLADAGEVVVEKGVHRRGGGALEAVALVGGEGVGEGAGGEERDGGEGDEGEDEVEAKEDDCDDEDLKDGNDALLEAIDEHALDGGDVLQYAGHEIASGTIVKPAEGQLLDVGVEVAAEIEDDVLLEGVIEEKAEAVEEVLGDEAGKENPDVTPEELRVMCADDGIDDATGDPRKDDNHAGAGDGAQEGERGQDGIAPEIAEYAGYGAELNGLERRVGVMQAECSLPQAGAGRMGEIFGGGFFNLRFTDFLGEERDTSGLRKKRGF